MFGAVVLTGRDVMREPLAKRREILESKVLPKLTEPVRYTLPLDAHLPDGYANRLAARAAGAPDRAGWSRAIPVDVRVVAPTNRDVSAAIAAGSFRSDLFYRLNVFPIHVPPLRKRREDIPILVEYLMV